MVESEQTLNLPQLLAFLLISGLAIRWFFFSSQSLIPSSRTQDSQSYVGRQVDERQVEQLQAMFPQLGRREIIWDLLRNGGSLQATIEKVLTGRTLEVPPPSFVPPLPPAAPQSTLTVPSQDPPIRMKSSNQQHQDLITRYNLMAKISSDASSASSDDSTLKTWSTNKEERQSLLHRRREEMILQARRKLVEKDPNP